ncbi:MAG: hypothetical protein JXA96_11735 [Sedimentisphaerales bacterium]|nr:hypothetical protein [Sedimentisphaerales bacterium]
MKKFVFAAIAVLAVTAVTLSLNAQPAGGGGFGGGAGGGGGFGGGAGGGMMGGMRGARGPVVRPDKAARLALIKELEAQVKTLVAAVEAAPAKDTEVTADSDQATIDKATAERQAETDALTAVQTTLASLRNAAAAGGGRGGRGMGGASADVLSELRVLASGEKATKTVAKLDALIKEAQTTGGARGGRGQGRGGMGGGGRGGAGGGGMMGGGAF